MKIAVKQKGNTEWSYVDPYDLRVGDSTLGSVLEYVQALETRVHELVGLLESKYVVSQGDIVAINGELYDVKSLQVFTERLNKPLHFYKVVDGKLELDRDKVGLIL